LTEVFIYFEMDKQFLSAYYKLRLGIWW